MHSVSSRLLVVLVLIAGIASGCSIAGGDDDGTFALTPQATVTTPALGAGDLTPSGETASASPSPDRPATVEVGPDGERVLTAPAKGERPTVSGDQTLVMAGSDDGPETLDPALVRDAESSFYTRQIFRGLVRLDNDMQAQPDLAERIVISADGLEYTFRLRPNATFHDGTPIDANAVAASFNRAADPALAGGDGFALPAAIYLIDIEGAESRLAGDTDTISGITVVDEVTLTMTLREPASNFLNKLTGNAAQVIDVDTVTGDDWWQEPNGSGPFILDEWSSSEIVLTSFAGFYDGAPLLSEVVVRLGQSAFQPLNLYESGEIDVTEVPLYAIDRVLSATDPLHDELTVVPQLSTTFILMNPNEEPFDDPAVREAVVAAFDRSKVAHVMLDGKVVQADGIVPPGILDREWLAVNPAYDLDAAQQAIASAGELDVPPTFYGSGAAVSLTTVLERDLSIDADAIGLEWSEFSARLTDRSLPAFSLTWIADFPDPANFLTAMFLTGSPDNYIGYSNAEVDRLLLEAEVVQDADERSRLYVEAQQLIIDDGVLIPLYHDVSYTVVQPHVNGLVVSPIGILSLEDIWIDD
ncbi:MAG TPA: peptide ABC transporter substrate-binding protein [Thermomicrobiales bacterium]|nr:peptide ABC transporter substrate-binding protein [Thermomicrobiales bacterium]